MPWFLSLLLTFCLLASPAFASSLIARLDRPAASVGETVELQLQLIDAQPQNEPDFNALRQNFDIEGIQTGLAMRYIDGQRKRVQRWQVFLRPKREGWAEIPAFQLYTDEGRLTSQPLQLRVGRPSGPPPQARPAPGIQPPAIGQPQRRAAQGSLFQAEVTPPGHPPYVGETVAVKAKLRYNSRVQNIEVSKPSAQGARVEIAGDITHRDLPGYQDPVRESTLHYLLTPLKTEGVSILPLKIEGERAQPLPHGLTNDPFGILDQLIGQMRNAERFQEQTQPIPLTVKPIPAAWRHGENRWLPAWDLQLAVEWGPVQTVSAGEPLTVDITITARGLYHNHLPNLSDLLRQSLPEADWDIYEDMPEQESQANADAQKLFSFRKQRFTLTPRRGGMHTIPTLQLPWWNLAADREAVATAAGTRFYVSGTVNPSPAAPAQKRQEASGGNDTPAPEEAATAPIGEAAATLQEMLPALLTVLAALLVGGGLWFWLKPAAPKAGGFTLPSPLPPNPLREAEAALKQAMGSAAILHAAQIWLNLRGGFVLPLAEALHRLDAPPAVLDSHRRLEAACYGPETAPHTLTLAEEFRQRLLKWNPRPARPRRMPESLPLLNP